MSAAAYGDLRARLAELARITRAPAPVVSAYLDTLWGDEHQRDRVRVFLADELKKARAGAQPGLAADLDWVAEQGEAIVNQARYPDARGVVLFACGALGLREILPLRVPVENLFAVGDTPHLRRLAELAEETPATLVVFVDAESARLIQLRADGVGREVALEREVPGHHRQGGWQLIAQSRYQRHIQAHRDQHYDAVAAAVTDLVDGHGVERIVLAGEPRAVAIFQQHLEGRIAQLVAGSVAGARHESSSAFVARATALLGRGLEGRAGATLDAVLTEAAKGGRATAGVDAVLDAAGRGAVYRLYLLRSFREAGRQCVACGALQRGAAAACRLCRAATKEVELGEALVQRALATGGSVETAEVHAELGRAGGVAALLRYPV
jgi:peptide subunit release factor 1 (eRF1)